MKQETLVLMVGAFTVGCVLPQLIGTWVFHYQYDRYMIQTDPLIGLGALFGVLLAVAVYFIVREKP